MDAGNYDKYLASMHMHRQDRCPSVDGPHAFSRDYCYFDNMEDQGVISMAAPDNPLFAQLNMACRKWRLEQSHMSQNLELENCADFHLRGQYSIP